MVGVGSAPATGDDDAEERDEGQQGDTATSDGVNMRGAYGGGVRCGIVPMGWGLQAPNARSEEGGQHLADDDAVGAEAGRRRSRW